MKLTLHPKELIFAIFLFIIAFSFYSDNGLHVPLVTYMDEALGIIASVYMAWYALKHNLGNIDFPVIVLTIICCLIGIFGNVQNQLIEKPFPVIVDIVCYVKVFLPFLMYRHLGQHDKKHYIMNYLFIIAKLFIITCVIFGTINLFFDIGMSDDFRYGLRSFCFVFGNSGRFGYLVACCLLIVVVCEKNSKKAILYNIMAIITMLYTTKGIIYIVVMGYIVLLIMWLRTAKLSVSNIIALSVGGVAISSFQINTYLKDTNSARMTLLKYGNVTARDYFPLGSGFATYGSDMAAKNYSVLYTKYGFQNVFGLSRQRGAFLNDCYLGCVLGQFGYFGTVCFVVSVAILFKAISKISLNSQSKALSIAIFVGLVVSTIGTGTIKSSIGILCLSLLGLVCGYSERAEYDKIKSGELDGTQLKKHNIKRKRKIKILT